METPSALQRPEIPNLESSSSGIHWSSILGGAATAAAISLILVPLGSALGFGSISIFNLSGTELTALSAGFAIWLIIMQWVSSGVGGYIAGRLRVKWAELHSDEVFFRDTAHGLIAWGVATLFTAGLLAALTLSTANLGVSAARDVSKAATDSEFGYYVDGLYRPLTPTASVIATAEGNAETTRILLNAVKSNLLPVDDRAYLSRQVSARTGLSTAQAEARVDATISQINAARGKAALAAEEARRVTVRVSIVLFLSLIVGAFIASVSAAIGGRQRDL